MKYATVLDDMGHGIFRRRDLLDALLKKYPNYNSGSFNRHLSRLLSKGLIENVGRDTYIVAYGGAAKETYSYKYPSERLSEVLSFLDSEFPLADFIVYETVQLNEFFDHQTAQNIVIVTAERTLTDAIFERMKEKFPSVLLYPSPEDIRRYAESGSVIIDRLSSRYPKNRAEKHGYSIEKLMVDIFAEKRIRSAFNAADYPSALENMFRRYRIDETGMFNYAKTRRVDAKIREMLRNDTDVKLHTDGEKRC
ncbi:MAG: hypothetical protein LBI08_02760 [Methanomassiliicoccaceae archaeon]|jgi:hypothetical protein|nr:hypothetical protein [Methanomassiliicoccaceae archaeon]